ncbi:MAG: TrkA C-terminal domain-containing protein, partial [Ktedonobacterales bacterium]
IHTTYSTSDLAAPTLAAAAVLGGVPSAFFTDSTLYAMDQLLAKGKDRLTGRTIATLAAQHDALVIGLTHNGASQLLPPYNTVIAPDDELTILARLDALAHLRGTEQKRK